MSESAVPYWLAFAVLLAGSYAGFKWYQHEQLRRQGYFQELQPEINLPPLEDFELTASNGQKFRSADMKGKVWVASFFFSTCAGTCSRLNGNLSALTRLDDVRDATFVSISVDPIQDTLPVLEAYAKRFNADPERWIFCRHDDFDYVKRVADDVLHIGVMYQGHKDHAVIIDKHGKIAGIFNAVSTIESQKGVEIIKQCLAEPYEPKPETGSHDDSSKPVEKQEMPADQVAAAPAEAA